MKRKIEHLEERFIGEEINGDLYRKFEEKYKAEKRESEQVITNEKEA